VKDPSSENDCSSTSQEIVAWYEIYIYFSRCLKILLLANILSQLNKIRTLIFLMVHFNRDLQYTHGVTIAVITSGLATEVLRISHIVHVCYISRHFIQLHWQRQNIMKVSIIYSTLLKHSVTWKSAIFWEVQLGNLIEVYQSFGGRYCHDRMSGAVSEQVDTEDGSTSIRLHSIISQMRLRFTVTARCP
jgi:hypothetical protein